MVGSRRPKVVSGSGVLHGSGSRLVSPPPPRGHRYPNDATHARRTYSDRGRVVSATLLFFAAIRSGGEQVRRHLLQLLTSRAL